MDLRKHLLAGQAIPAHPLALDHRRRFSERHQRALTRYHLASGVGGLAVAVHSTQFEIRDPSHNLFRPVLELAAETARDFLGKQPRDVALIAGVCGRTSQALDEAQLARALGYHAALVSMAAFRDEPEETILAHLSVVAEILPVIGFYLQPAVGGRTFSVDFWRGFFEIENVVAVKIAPFNRYQTIDVVRAAVEVGREDVALYTGNDDTIISDLLTPFSFSHAGQPVTRRIVGGLLGHWGAWTRAAVDTFNKAKIVASQPMISSDWFACAAAVTDMNAALFDAANRFAGCIPGILEILRRQRLVETNLCLNPHEKLSPGQAEELTRVTTAYPQLTDDDFIAENLDAWLK
ncbi:dihydrodipicolinate synthase family protein [Nibricoccus aquaticus]|uniref:Dihydrodipicolinate synthase family protein n=1 Tax=Nibricoccus aquaticus TaxID=2576891 RepID=A0A290QH07_9BACT|nr:dihydrodipicolinate synthase family protein [Nibricoccus aquaticus]ATC64628.1 dihydrodipicolinate synthase family protein [Nibricoccus aquaticus]